MTTSRDPASAEVFTVGRNQSREFEVDKVGSHERHLDALFSRGPETCYKLYELMTEHRGGPSLTRQNTGKLVRKLSEHGLKNVIETNVDCYSTRMSEDLRRDEHQGGSERGREIFLKLFNIIKPTVLIVHGSGATKELGRALNCKLPRPPTDCDGHVKIACGDIVVFVISSLAPPGYYRWSRWADSYLDKVSRRVADHLAAQRLRTGPSATK